MLKMLVQVHRTPGMSDDRFYSRWEMEHGDLVKRLSKPMGFVRYIQTHRRPSDEIAAFAAGRGWLPPSDGQAALWWESFEAMIAALATAEGAEASAALEVDEKAFTNTRALSAFIAIEKTIFDFTAEAAPRNGVEPVKMVVEVYKQPGMTDQDFAHRWRGAHGDLVRAHASAIGFTRYVQNHRDRTSPLDFAQTRGWMPAPDGVTEVWWESKAAMKAAFATPEAAQASAILAADEAQFIDKSRISAYFGIERCIFDHMPRG